MFVHKSVNPSLYLGMDLQELRRRAGWSRQAMAQATKIHESLIRALEEEQWDEISDPISTERILRGYVNFLGGKERYFLQKYRACLREHNLEREPHQFLPWIRRIRARDLTVLSRLVTIGGFILFALFLGGYVYFQVRAMNVPPPLSLEEPLDGSRLERPLVHVYGKTLPESTVLINDQQVAVQADGTFRAEIDVPRGTTVLTISAKRRHGRASILTRRVIYDRPLPVLER